MDMMKKMNMKNNKKGQINCPLYIRKELIMYKRKVRTNSTRKPEYLYIDRHLKKG